MQFPQTSTFNRSTNYSAALSAPGTRKTSDFDIVANFGLLRRRASDADVISDKESLYYQFRVDRLTKVRMTLENRLERDPIAGFFRDRSLFGRFLDADGRRISRASDSARPEDTVALVSRRLRPGTYYLQLKSNFSDDIRYRVQLRRTAQ
jgi:hypothetical protein